MKDRRNFVFLLPIALTAILEFFCFRNVIFTDRLFGDLGDGRLLNLFAEHWFGFFKGNEAWNNTIAFFPAENSLGYSDLLLGFGVIHSVFRATGLDMFYAYKFTLISVHIFGSYSAYYLFKNRLNFSAPVTLIGVIMFAYSNMYIAVGHAQLFAVYYVPFFFIMLFNAITAYRSAPRKSFAFFMITVVTVALIFYTSYYVGYFLFLFCLTLLIVYCILCHKRNFPAVPLICGIIRKEWRAISVLFIFLIILFIPFTAVYLPVLRMSGYRDFNEVLFYSPSVIDFINIADTSVLYGKLLRAVPAGILDSGEHKIGVPLISMIIFLFSCRFLVRRLPEPPTKEGDQSRSRETPDHKKILAASAAISILVCMALMVKIGGYSAWFIIWKLFPGAGAIRAVGRFNQFLALPLGFVVCSYLQSQYDYNKDVKPLLRNIAAIATVMFFAVEYTWAGGIQTYWTAAQSRAFLNEIPTPPADCEVMYVKLSPPPPGPEQPEPNYKLSLDAWLIAARYGLKTINGYSGQAPRNWITGIADANYEQSVVLWINRWGLTNVRAYNLVTKQWEQPPQFSESISDGKVVSFGTGTNDFFYIKNGFSGQEEGFRRTEGNEATLIFGTREAGENDIIAEFTVSPLLGSGLDEQRVEVMINGIRAEDWVINAPAAKELLLPKEQIKGETMTIEFKLPDAASPKELGINGDERKLAVAFREIRFKTVKSPMP
ncbi:hypothetical protein FACS1894216_19540 [Synergistales bacterium]|nr:hypothetical protein FACS1894216_19540 [Synergistales bacterium]